MSLLESLYTAAVRVLRPVLPAFRAASPKVSAAVEGRRTAARDIAAWSRERRETSRPLLWLHGASAGELSGAIPVVRRVRRTCPDIQLLVTYSSPSAVAALQALDPDHAGYPPLETSADCGLAIEASRPSAVVFAKLDAWPALTRAAADAEVPLGMINATVRPGSSRLRGPGRRLLLPTYGRLSAIGAVTEKEVDRLLSLGARPEAIVVTGDASLEQSVDRIDAARAAGHPPRLPAPPPGTVRLVAGSTWPEDERVLLEGAARLQAAPGGESAADSPPFQSPRLELVLVPHEPDEESVRRISGACRERLGVEPRVWSRLSSGDAGSPTAPLVVDAVGFLAELYLECDVAWVGGGVGGEGLHSVVEPAAAGVPVLFGPVHDRWEALELIERGGARSVQPADLAGVLLELAADRDLRGRMGRAGREFVETGRGASDASAALIGRLLAGTAGP